MPLFSRPSPSLPTSYSSKPLKPQKPNSAVSTPRFPPSITVFSIICFFFGLAGTIFGLTALRRPNPVPVFRCGKSYDTFRAFYSASNSRKLGNEEGLIDRPKFLGFVGIQTSFNSADRRAALRSTWFPSDPDSLLRYMFFFIFWALSRWCWWWIRWRTNFINHIAFDTVNDIEWKVSLFLTVSVECASFSTFHFYNIRAVLEMTQHILFNWLLFIIYKPMS